MERLRRQRGTDSALSPGVKLLLCAVGTTCPVEKPLIDDNKDQLCLSQNKPQLLNNQLGMATMIYIPQMMKGEIINIDWLVTQLLPPHDDGDTPSKGYYKEAVAKLAPVFKACEDLLACHSSEEFSVKYGHYFLWTKNKKPFLQCFELLTYRNGADDLLALLLVCGELERALGNLYLLRGSQCPAMLKDLLTTPQLHNILGSAVIKLLHVLIGPPISMNLRNVSWHGFLTENELPRSLGKLLEDRGIDSDSVQSKDYVPLTKVDEIAEHLGSRDLDIPALGNCIMNSWLVDSGNVNLFKSAFRYYESQKYGWCVVQLLPLLEHAMRKVFVAVNNCPERLITAEATTLYTTFEEILDSSLPDGSLNAVVDALGIPCLDLLHDLLVYPNGPRARDKLGHGEADFDAVPKSLADVVILVFTYLAVGIMEQSGDNNKNTTKSLCCIQNYSSIFHPVAVLKLKIQNLTSKTHHLHQHLRASPTLEPWEMSDGYDLFVSNNDMFAKIQDSFAKFLDNLSMRDWFIPDTKLSHFQQRITLPFQNLKDHVESILPPRTKTLYRWQRDGTEGTNMIAESEIVGLLSRIIAETEICLSQTKSALLLRQDQLENKQLRSRQRDNMKRLMMFLPCESLFVNFITVLSVWIFVHLDSYSSLDDAKCKTLQKFLKSTLRTCENGRSFTSADTNKWSQAAEAMHVELKIAVEFSGKKIF